MHARTPFLAISLAVLCACGTAASSPECISGARPVCGCADGRTGYQECLDDGTFGECVCTGPVPGADTGPPDPVEDAGSSVEDSGSPLLDAGAPPDAGDAPLDAGPPPGALWVSRTAPAIETVHTRDTVMLQYVASRPVDRVELLLDGELFAELTPPYTYAWDTRPYSEGEHTIVARAVRGDEVASAETLTVVVDRTSPWIVSRFPAPNDPDTWLGEPFVIELSEPVRASTVTDAAISVTAGSAVPLRKTLSVDATGRRIEVRLAELPVLPATLRVDVTSMATDLAGNPIVGDAWGLGVPVFARMRETLAPAGAAPDLSLTMDEASAAPYLAWTESGVARVVHWDGAAWSTLPPLDPTPDAIVSQLAVTADGTGAPIVAWRSTVGATDRISVARWTGTAWAPLGGGRVVPSSQAAPSIALDGSGDVLLARLQAPTEVHVERWTGSAWAQVGPPITAPVAVGAVAVTARGTGEIVVAVGAAATTGPGSFASQWDGTSWAPLGTGNLFIPYFYSPHSVTQLRLFSAGDRLAAYGAGAYTFGSSSPMAYAELRWWVESYWSSGNPVTPALAFDPDGRAHAATTSSTGATVHREQGSGWVTSTVATGSSPVVAIDLFYGRKPAIAAARGGRITVYRTNELDL